MQRANSVTPSQLRQAANTPPREKRGNPILGEAVPDEGDLCGYPLDKQDQVLMNQVTRHFQRALQRGLPGQQFLRRLGLNDPELVTTFRLGFSDRTLCHKIGNPRTAAGGAVRGRLQRLGILRPSGHELFRGSLVVPILDAHGNTVDMWGHKVSTDQRYHTPLQISLFDPPRGVFNLRGLKGHEDIILCGGVLDTMTFWCQGFRNVTATLGVRGLTIEHMDSFERLAIKRVVIAFERTKMGDDEARLVAQALDAARIECRRLDLPAGLDVNSYTRLRYPTKGTLADMLRDAHPFRQVYITHREDLACPRAQKSYR